MEFILGFNRIIGNTSSKVHFPASYVRLPECIPKKPASSIECYDDVFVTLARYSKLCSMRVFFLYVFVYVFVSPCFAVRKNPAVILLYKHVMFKIFF